MSRSPLFHSFAPTKRRLILCCAVVALLLATGASIVSGKRQGVGPEQAGTGSASIVPVGAAAPAAGSAPTVPAEAPLPWHDPNSTVCTLAC